MMLARVQDLHECAVGGRIYLFRTPTAYDVPQMRWALMRRGVRRPMEEELRVAAIAGVEALAEMADDAIEGERQVALLRKWHELLVPLIEDDIDEPDLEKRAELLAQRQTERRETLAGMAPEVAAIESVLVRHWPPYSELLADRALFDELSAIEIVRLLLVKMDGATLARDETDRLTDSAYQMLVKADCPTLAAFATQLLIPSEAQSKN